MHADDVITQLVLLGRASRPPVGNSGTQTGEQQIAQAIVFSVRVVQHIFVTPPSHSWFLKAAPPASLVTRVPFGLCESTQLTTIL